MKSQTTNFYGTLCSYEEYSSHELRSCIENTVTKLSLNDTSVNKPGMLLGKIQSGKTRAFIGVMGRAFDQGYDITIILTKGTKALAEQTFQRLKKEFAYFIQLDQIQLFNIMAFPDNLSKYERNQKIIFVVKKQKDNLSRLNIALFDTYSEMQDRKILMIDDEADFASIGFSKKDERLQINTIAGQIDDLRKNLKHCDFLQVTATPYSLYLQPEELTIGANVEFVPIKPAFTELVPVNKHYIGGEYYFERSDEQDSVASHIYEEVAPDEIRILKKADRRSFKIEDALTSNKIRSLRNAMINFIVGGCIRRIQNRQSHEVEKKYSFIIHTEQAKIAHGWQEDIVIEIKEKFTTAALNGHDIFIALLKESYDNLIKSVVVFDSYNPSLAEVKDEVVVALREEYLMVTRVNSDKEVNELLDDTGQLKLRTPLNIYIGGQILDRGITIGNLIGFYYGRSPQKYQQDTVLQHSRMFGYRPLEDLTVTRFYTTIDIYEVMKKIHEFDSALRNAFEKGSHDNGVIFIQKDEKGKIVPCSPNKVLLSSTTTLKPLKRLLPVGFQTGCKTNIRKSIDDLNEMITSVQPKQNKEAEFLMDLDLARKIICKIVSTLVFAEGYSWDSNAFIASMDYLSMSSSNKDLAGKVWVVVRTKRNIQRLKKNKFQDSPDTGKDENSEVTVAKEAATDIPALILLQQNGLIEHGWQGIEFWWPILIVPKNTKSVIFSGKLVE